MFSSDKIFIIFIVFLVFGDTQVSSIPNVSQRDVAWIIVRNFSFANFCQNIMIVYPQQNIDILFHAWVKLIEQPLQLVNLLLTILDEF